MKLGFIVPVVLLSMSGWALAQSMPPATITPVVPSGKTRQVGFFTSLNPDCTGAGDIDARITKQPQNGSVEVEPGTGFAVYPEKNPRAVCNTKQVQGIRIKYTSKEAYTGKDTFEVEFLTPAGGRYYLEVFCDGQIG